MQSESQFAMGNPQSPFPTAYCCLITVPGCNPAAWDAAKKYWWCSRCPSSPLLLDLIHPTPLARIHSMPCLEVRTQCMDTHASMAATAMGDNDGASCMRAGITNSTLPPMLDKQLSNKRRHGNLGSSPYTSSLCL
ncbi:hypothetical protein S7711_11060 [Stachybotrys chartarum IBT 7711]|uniref:Uncharacterized protein n=1 Tax=Stachybotrys chartarum (strain CBS 109288 / IBT 7711) TaxID=1280523 RepID=A0A084AKY9_STACB|nr:hypothetical protein S7711_11060 [Stachybotrys chartarum IBT 7711]KFA46646.1 hypothetical protein S40293_11248 [Stachybotrys chartarum IBT 40293]